MNHFRTIVSIKPSNHKIGLINGVFTIGSCFADAIGLKLEQSKFRVAVNPFGTTYNPLSIHKNLRYALGNQVPPANTYLQREDLHFNYDFHSSLSALEKTSLTDLIQATIVESHNFLKSAGYVLITYGTAWLYALEESGEIVNNCHKIAARHFSKRLMTEREMVESFDTLYAEAKKINPALKFILTLSPVRHLKDTLVLNSLSKAVLRSGCHAITSTYEDVEYFPAFEIMMDDLRDYRFYKSDMLHPTDEAENYIWESFMNTYCESSTIAFLKEWQVIRSGLNHSPFHPTSQSHQKFLKETLAKLYAVRPKINVDAEIAAVQAQILTP